MQGSGTRPCEVCSTASQSARRQGTTRPYLLVPPRLPKARAFIQLQSLESSFSIDEVIHCVERMTWNLHLFFGYLTVGGVFEQGLAVV